MLIGGVALGLLAGLLAGGRLEHLVTVRLRFIAVLFLAVILRFLTEAGLDQAVSPVNTFRLPLFATAYGLLLVALWANRRHPGLAVAFVGVLLNGFAIVANGGFMPIWEPALIAAGFNPADIHSAVHTILPPALDANFLLHAGPLSDLIPIPLPLVQNVASLGDTFLALGLAFFLFSTVVRAPGELEAEAAEAAASGPFTGLAGTARLPRTVESVVTGRSVRAETGLMPSLADMAVMDRVAALGGVRPGTTRPGGAGAAGQRTVAGPRTAAGAATPTAAANLAAATLAAPALAPLPGELVDVFPLPAAAGVTTAIPPTPVLERVRRQPYVQLALNGSFSALWIGQLISLFGDRAHQIALAFLVYGLTGSPIALSFVFVAATIPNLLIGPIAGTFVDRWDHKEVMIVSDLLRAAAVLLIPVAALTNILLVYPLIFLVTSISIFFRPARTAAIPRIVRSEDLMTANSAMWVAETLADVIGYPLAGVFVVFLGQALPLAFWIDGASYLASAVLIASMAIPVSAAPEPGASPGVVAETLEGWRFLRRERALLANTLQGVVGQFTAGSLIALTYIYAANLHVSASTPAYALMETAIGAGNLVGGLIVGLVGVRLAKGRTVILGYAIGGLCTAGLAMTGSLSAALGLALGIGVANMVYVIPSQTLFQERTPMELMGRVVGTRFALVFGSMTLAMAVSGFLAEAVGVNAVFAAVGLIMAAAGVAGVFVPSVRNA